MKTFPAVAILMALLLALAACGSSSREADVKAAARSPGGTRIDLQLGTCNADLSSRVEETEREVRVLVTARNEENGTTCADYHTITLSEPLGDRLLIDEFDGEPVAVSLDSTIPDAP